jgi:hypothetical protein
MEIVVLYSCQSLEQNEFATDFCLINTRDGHENVRIFNRCLALWINRWRSVSPPCETQISLHIAPFPVSLTPTHTNAL